MLSEEMPGESEHGQSTQGGNSNFASVVSGRERLIKDFNQSWQSNIKETLRVPGSPHPARLPCKKNQLFKVLNEGKGWRQADTRVL